MIPAGPINTGQTSVPFTVPPPTGGLNGRDPLAAMPKTDAYLLDNWYPDTGKVVTRKGNVPYVAGHGSPVVSLETYTGGTGDRLLSFASGKVYDLTAGTLVEIATGRSNDYVITTMFSNAADNAQHLIVVNGVDVPARYDGSAFSNLAITGVTGSANDLNYVMGFKGRLYFAQKDKLGFWYLAPGAIQGAATYFDLAQQSRLGGYLVAIASFSNDSGDGLNDFIVFITSKGECIVYQGFNPASAADWLMVGRYYTSTPIGKKCAFNYQGDLIILTLQGAIPFSQIMRNGDTTAKVEEQLAITDKLGSFLSDFNANADVPGWEATYYSRGGFLILNVPSTSSISGDYYHYVMNSKTQAWARFKGWNGLCFAVFNRRLYFGTYDGRVMLGDEGFKDDGEPIKCDCKQAYNQFEDGSGIGQLAKHFQWAKVIVKCNGSPPISGQFNVDYVEDQPQFITNLEPDSGAEWDVAEWDVASWGFDGTVQNVIITLNKSGVAGALWLRAYLDGVYLEWYATQTVMVKTKALLP